MGVRPETAGKASGLRRPALALVLLAALPPWPPATARDERRILPAHQAATPQAAECSRKSPMKIRFRFPDAAFSVTLDDQPAARELAAMLPLRLKTSDFGSAEKIAYLPHRLDVAGLPAGTDAAAGDLAYYAPWGNLALFYRAAPYATGLVRLGRVEGAFGALGRQRDGVVTVECLDE